MFAVTAAEFTLKARPTSLSTRTSPFGSVHVASSRTTASSSAPSFPTLYMSFFATSSYHPSRNDGVERVNHTMAQIPAMVVNEHQDDWDTQLPHVELAYNNSVSVATGLAPHEVHMGRRPRLPHYFRPLRGRRPSEPGLRPPCVLQPGVRMPTSRRRCCSRDACLNSFPCGTAKLSPFGRFAPGPQLRCGSLGLAV